MPAGVTSVTIQTFGAQGGAGGVETSGFTPSVGGNGGAVNATITVTPGETLIVNVGGRDRPAVVLRRMAVLAALTVVLQVGMLVFLVLQAAAAGVHRMCARVAARWPIGCWWPAAVAEGVRALAKVLEVSVVLAVEQRVPMARPKLHHRP
jgi:hypothetical protein